MDTVYKAQTQEVTQFFKSTSFPTSQSTDVVVFDGPRSHSKIRSKYFTWIMNVLPSPKFSSNLMISVQSFYTFDKWLLISRMQGLEQMGIAATIAHCISLLPEDLQGMFWANIGLIGGSTKFPGFRDRLYAITFVLTPSDQRFFPSTWPHRSTELRALAPVECEVLIFQSQEYDFPFCKSA